jgi:hypothetical protein
MFGSMMGHVEEFMRRKGKVEIQRVVYLVARALSPLSHLLYQGFPVFFVYPPSWYMARNAQEALRGVPQQYSALEVQRRREDDRVWPLEHLGCLFELLL